LEMIGIISKQAISIAEYFMMKTKMIILSLVALKMCCHWDSVDYTVG
jgi:hypothetical protein